MTTLTDAPHYGALMPTVSVRDLTFRYPGQSPIFEGLNLSLEQASVIEVRGANGSGKSTLARLLTGLIPPTKGDIVLNGSSMLRVSGRQRAKLARYVPQRVFEFFLFSTVAAELKSTMKRNSSKSTGEMLKDFIIEAAPDVNPADLGELESWRLALLLSAATDPSVLYVDEIPSQSSRKCLGVLMRLMRRRRDLGLVTLFSTHRRTALSQEATAAILLQCQNDRTTTTLMDQGVHIDSGEPRFGLTPP